MVFIGESPAADELMNKPEPKPFVGRSGKMLNAALRLAGIDRTQVRLMNLVPVRAPSDKFALHDPADVEYGRERLHAELRQLTNAKVFVALGANPTEWLLGGKPPVVQRGDKAKEGFIGEWRGSVVPVDQLRDVRSSQAPEDYLTRLAGQLKPPVELPQGSVIIPTFHPAAVLRQFAWHPWLTMDIAKAARVNREGLPKLIKRQWFINDPDALWNLIKAECGSCGGSGIVDGGLCKNCSGRGHRPVDLIATDSEMDPWIVSVVCDDEVHVFDWNEKFREPLEAILTHARIIKVAHNWTHDFAFFRKCLKIDTQRPLYDTQGGAHLLNNALQKELSPHIASRFTDWPYHKWLANHDQLIYCGMDGVVCFDAYWPQERQLRERRLYDSAVHDHKLLVPLMEMQKIGFKIDESERIATELELERDLKVQDAELGVMVEPIIESRFEKFEKPHLFRVPRKCACCGGGKTQREHCWQCLNDACQMTMVKGPPKKKLDYYEAYSSKWANEGVPFEEIDKGFKKVKVAELRSLLPPCTKCSASGRTIKKLQFNSDSPDQVADVLYRGLRVKARKFHGQETTKAAQLDAIRDQHPIIAKIVDISQVRADYDTVSRLRAGVDGLLHCVFDPFGTGSGRVAGKEGLLEQGTNPMNLPLKARRFVVPRDGYTFLYPDMAQIEARAVAVLSQDKALIEAFNTLIDWPGNPRHGTVDSHTRVVQLMMASGVQITRDQAKRLTYAAMYGGRADQLTKELNAEAFRKGQDLRVTVEQTQFMLDTFFRVFSGIKTWHVRVLDEVQRTRRLRCPLTGRERTWLGYIVETNKRSPQFGSVSYEISKQVWSFLPQWIGAYVLGLGLIDIYYNSGEWGKLLTPLVHVHDALLIEAPSDRVVEAKALALKLLTREMWGIKFPADMKTGKNWYEASGGV